MIAETSTTASSIAAALLFELLLPRELPPPMNMPDQSAIRVKKPAIIYAISFLLTRALSRYRELSADRSGAILIGRPSMLASALIKVSGEIGRIPTRDLRSASAFNAFYFAPALTQGVSLGNLVSTHPTLEKRLEQLSKLEEQMNRPS